MKKISGKTTREQLAAIIVAKLEEKKIPAVLVGGSVVSIYSEGEYVIATGRRSNRFLYNWSELSLWATDWLRAGMVTQRTRIFRTFRTTRDIQRGALVGVAGSRLEGVFYLFNPGSDDHYYVASISVSF